MVFVKLNSQCSYRKRGENLRRNCQPPIKAAGIIFTYPKHLEGFESRGNFQPVRAERQEGLFDTLKAVFSAVVRKATCNALSWA